jgi:3-dehydroquinate synthase
VVTRDERETGRRMVLNYGHTVGHAIEKSLGYGRLLHGEAVIVGLAAALELGRRQGMNHRSLDAYSSLVENSLRLVPRRKLGIEDLLDAMTVDKKRSSADQRYVLLEKVGQPVVCDHIDRRTVRLALETTVKLYESVGGKSVKSFGRSRA